VTRKAPHRRTLIYATPNSYAIMIEAVKLDDLPFIEELVDRGLPMDSLYALEAIKVKGKDALEVFLQNRWNINQPISEREPPVLV